MLHLPNLIFIMPDQLRHDFLGCYGADFVETPNIDSIAKNGVRYSMAYSVSPICVPARAMLLTGRSAIKNGVTDNGQWLRPDLADLGIHTWPELLNEQGYYTAAIGKMHFFPWDITHGFQYRVAAEDKRWIHVRDEYYHHLRQHGERKYHGNEHDGYFENKGAIINRLPWELSVDHFVGEEACRFLRKYGRERPFAMMVGFPGPHCPYDPNEEWLEGLDPDAMPAAVPEVDGDTPKLRQNGIEGNKKAWNGVDYTEFTDEQKRKIRLHYAASVKQIDYEVGQILETLQDQGLMEKTVIIFASDHGDHLGDHNLIGKSDFYEGSVHVPMLVQGPGIDSGKTCTELVELGDVTATLLKLSGSERPDYMDSVPLPALGLGERRQRPYSIGVTTGGWMFFDGRWKLAKYSTGEITFFDLENDPTEQVNLMRDPAYDKKFHELDTLLTLAIMRAVTEGDYDQRVDLSGLATVPAFGHRGWQRTYPLSL